MGIDFDYPEGATPLDPNESEGLVPLIATQSELNDFEALNILEGARWARRSRLIKNDLLAAATLRELHRRMFGKTWTWAGKYRTTQKSIGCEAYQIGSELKILAEDVVCWLEFNTYPPVELAARFHHRLVCIHPFPNGNGRFARLATDLLCENRGWPVPTWGSQDLVNLSDARKADIDALRAADRWDYSRLNEFLYR